MTTRRPRILSRRPRLEAVRPLPRLDATPPVTNRCLVCTGLDWPGSGRRWRAGAGVGFTSWGARGVAPPGDGWPFGVGALEAEDFGCAPAACADPEPCGDAAKIGLPWSAMSRLKPQVHGPPG